MKKKLLSILLVLSMLVGMLTTMPLAVGADTTAWDGNAASGFASGDGSQDNPYKIETPAQWEYFAQECFGGNSFEGKYIELVNDITFNTGDSSTWATTAPANSVTPVGCDGDSTNAFSGNFNGNGKTISGVYMYVDSHWGGGLFGTTTNATISNLVLVNSSFVFVAKGWAAAVAGENYDDLTVSNVYVSESVYIKSIDCGAIGGIVGGLESGSDVTVTDCVFAGTVDCAKDIAGGIIGSSNSKNLAVTNCLFIGSVSGGQTVAGIAGGQAAKGSTIKNCIAAGEATHFAIAYKLKDNTNAYVYNSYYLGSTATNSSAKTENVNAISGIVEIYGDEATVTMDDWTKRANDVMIPNGVASFNIPNSKFYGTIEEPEATLRGDGTEASPYLIGSVEDWELFDSYSESGETFEGMYIALDASIDFEGATIHPVFCEMCGSKIAFEGSFDGRGYSLSNFVIETEEDSASLFGLLGGNAEIKNLTVSNARMNVGQWAGVIAGGVKGSVTVENVFVANDVVIDTFGNYGGIIGGPYGGTEKLTVSNCVFAGTITATSKGYVAGIVGCTNSKTVEISDCLYLGNIKNENNYTAGIATASGTVTITDCVSAGNLTGKNYVGGIYSGNPDEEQVISVTGCYSVSTVYAQNTSNGGTVTAENNEVVSISKLFGANATVPASFTKRAGDIAVPTGCTVAPANVYGQAMIGGASVRMAEPSGLRFTAVISAAYLNSLVNGATEFTYGIIIAPTDYVKTAGAFSIEALTAAGLTYKEIEAKKILTNPEEDGCYMFTGTLAPVQDFNHDRAFSAIAYVKVGDTYYYSSYNEVFNSRSIANVAKNACEDTNPEQNEVYKYAVTEGETTVYSPYTDDQRKLLAGFFQ